MGQLFAKILEIHRSLYARYPKTYKTIFTIKALILLYIIYKKWQYSQKFFKSKSETANKAVLITGCDTGFGNAIAMKLSIKHGFKAIATCLKQESVDKFLSNASFTQNGSTAMVLDVTKKENIELVKKQVQTYLNDSNAIFWGIVNNAGFFIPGSFEVVHDDLDMLERNVLFYAPLNIIRAFLPLLPGRANYPKYKSGTFKNNGGRIVNISSITSKVIFDVRYGVSKAALAYFTHSLRIDVSPRFGIWCSSIEPGFFKTAILHSAGVWGQRVIQKLKDNDQQVLLDIYEFEEKFKKENQEAMKLYDSLPVSLDPVVDDVIHALSAKYPMREYQPNKSLMWKILIYAPFWITERMSIM